LPRHRPQAAACAAAQYDWYEGSLHFGTPSGKAYFRLVEGAVALLLPELVYVLYDVVHTKSYGLGRALALGDKSKLPP
jgi:hypothetical protein